MLGRSAILEEARSNPDCWSGGFTEEICCNVSYDAGNPACWDGIFTYETCCLSTRSSDSIRSPSADCWSGGFTEALCCNALYDAGNPACWDGMFTYELCCPSKLLVTNALNDSSAQPVLEVGRAECWNADHNVEKWCCDRSSQDAACWQGENSYNRCCKRDPWVIASLAAMRNGSMLEVAAQPRLDLPFQQESSICGDGRGHVDKVVCDLLQHAEHMLRHPLRSDCWSEDFMKMHCCNTRVSHDDPVCFAEGFTHEACCLGVSPQVKLLQQFYNCDHCMSMLNQSKFNCDDYHLCWQHHGGIVIATSRGLLRSADIVCLPAAHDTVSTVEAITSSAAFALQWVRAHHDSDSFIDLNSRMGANAMEIVCMLGPWLLGATGIWHRKRVACRQPNQRDLAIDSARMVVTVAIVSMHLAFVFRERSPEANKHLAIWHYNLRFVDIFGVIAVLLSESHSESCLASWDALWRKLARQVPLSFVYERSQAWASGICSDLASCTSTEQSSWSFQLVVRCLTFSHHWNLHLDLKIWLALRAVYILNHQGLSPMLVAALVVPISLACLHSGYLSNMHNPELYYQFWTYRLPMSLLVLFVALRRRRLQDWGSRYPWAWTAVAAALCSLGWVRCIPKLPHDDAPVWWQDPCIKEGSSFFLGGMFFHVGVAMFCLQPPFATPQALRRVILRLSTLTTSILILHWRVFSFVSECEYSSSPSLLMKGPTLHLHIAEQAEHESSRWAGICLWTLTVLSCPLVAQLVLWTIQHPWERLFLLCPKPISRAITFAYVLFFAWCWN